MRKQELLDRNNFILEGNFDSDFSADCRGVESTDCMEVQNLERKRNFDQPNKWKITTADCREVSWKTGGRISTADCREVEPKTLPSSAKLSRR